MQLDYNDMERGVEGGLADATYDADIVAVRSAVDVRFGRGLKFAATGLVAPPATVIANMAGIAVQKNIPRPNATQLPVYDAGEEVSVLRRGRIYVLAEDPVDPTKGVFCRFAGRPQVQELVFSADLITGNTVNGSIGGVAITEVTFATDHLTTMGVVAANIETAAGGLVTAVVGGASNRTITITSDADVFLDVAVYDSDRQVVSHDWVVAAGASQATVTPDETNPGAHSVNDIGKFRTTADDPGGGATAGAFGPAKWVSTTTLPNRIAALDINLP